MMPDRLLERFSRMMGNNPSLKKVADDLRLTSELILLVRMIFADGELKAVELDAFKKLCSSAFGLNEEDIPGVLKYLKDFGYETTAWDAAAMFKSYSPERKREMLLHLLEIAKSDGQVHESEAEMIRRTADILGLTAEEIHTMRAG